MLRQERQKVFKYCPQVIKPEEHVDQDLGQPTTEDQALKKVTFCLKLRYTWNIKKDDLFSHHNIEAFDYIESSLTFTHLYELCSKQIRVTQEPTNHNNLQQTS